MKLRRRLPLPVLLGGLMLLAGCGSREPASNAELQSNTALQQQVMATERAFAATMARRDRNAFAGHLDAEAIFFSGKEVLRGREQVAAAWAGYFDGSDAPFSWEPDSVQVLDSGTLALSTGPVRDPEGHVIARFNSIWRRDASGAWKILFDKGSPPEPGDRKEPP